MTRAIATDLDGTAVFGYTAHPEDARALARWREAGNLVVASTARSRPRALGGLKLLEEASGTGAPVHDYVIASTGGVILDRDGEVLRALELTPDDARTVMGLVGERDDVSFSVLTLEEPYIIHDPIDANAHRIANGSGYTPLSIDEVDGLDISSMTVVTSGPEAAEALSRQLGEALGDAADLSLSHQFVDIVPKGVSKASALTWLFDRIRAAGTEVTAVDGVGDSLNDVPLFEFADTGWAMASATDGVKAKADGVVTSIAELVSILEAQD